MSSDNLKTTSYAPWDLVRRISKFIQSIEESDVNDDGDNHQEEETVRVAMLGGSSSDMGVEGSSEPVPLPTDWLREAGAALLRPVEMAASLICETRK